MHPLLLGSFLPPLVRCDKANEPSKDVKRRMPPKHTAKVQNRTIIMCFPPRVLWSFSWGEFRSPTSSKCMGVMLKSPPCSGPNREIPDQIGIRNWKMERPPYLRIKCRNEAMVGRSQIARSDEPEDCEQSAKVESGS